MLNALERSIHVNSCDVVSCFQDMYAITYHFYECLYGRVFLFIQTGIRIIYWILVKNVYKRSYIIFSIILLRVLSRFMALFF